MKLEYTNKEEADASRIQIAKGVQSQSLLFAISNAMSQAYMLGYEIAETEILSK